MIATRTRFALGVCCILLARPDLAAQSAKDRPQPPARQPALLVSFAENPGSLNRGRPEGREQGEGGEARNRDEMETDRDSFTPATTTAGRQRLIVESAYSFLDNRRAKETHSYPELLFRYGLTERLELRWGWNYEVGGAGDEISGVDVGENDLLPGSNLERESRISYGLKFRVTEQCRWVPNSAVILQGFSPTSGKATDTLFGGTYVFGWELPNQWKLDSAIRYATGSAEEDRFSSWAPSVVLKVPLGERVNIHAEYFGIFSADKAEAFNRQFVSPGFHYLITPDLEVGVRVGWGLNDQSARFFANAGFGWRF